MDFKLIEKYNNEFFKNQSIKEEVSKNRIFFDTIINRGNYLKKGQIIFNDSLDMEAVSTPYNLDLTNLEESPNGDLEWCYMASRNGYLVDLGILYAYTKEEVYFKLWKKYLFSFIDWQEKSPHVWRSLDVGLRLNNWMKSFIYISDLTNQLSSTEKIKLEKSIIKQIIYLKKNFPNKSYLSNWGVLAITGVLSTSQLLPELVDKETEEWAWTTLTEALEIQFYDDGIQWEQSPMYHHEVTICMLQLWLNSYYLEHSFPAHIQSILEKAINVSYYYCDHAFNLLSLHDSDAVDFTYVYSIYELLGFLDINMNKTPGIFYTGKKINTEKKKLLPNLFETGESGFLAYKDANIYLTLFNGRHGSGHGHGSLGSITLDYQGKELIKDPGRYTYLEVPLRSYLKEEFSHSSLIVDGKPLTQIDSSWSYRTMAEPIFHKSFEDREYVLFEISWHGKQENNLVIFKRTIIYFKKLMVILVVNTTDCPGNHILSTRYQMGDNLQLDKQENNILLKSTPFALLVGNQANVAINKKTWSPKYNEKEQYEEILLEQSFNNNLVTYECFYPWNQVEVEKVDCYQNNQSDPCDMLLCFGVKMTTNQGEVYEYYHSAYDTFRGDKLYLGDQGRLLYGKHKIFRKKLGE